MKHLRTHTYTGTKYLSFYVCIVVQPLHYSSDINSANAFFVVCVFFYKKPRLPFPRAHCLRRRSIPARHGQDSYRHSVSLWTAVACFWQTLMLSCVYVQLYIPGVHAKNGWLLFSEHKWWSEYVPGERNSNDLLHMLCCQINGKTSWCRLLAISIL